MSEKAEWWLMVFGALGMLLMFIGLFFGRAGFALVISGASMLAVAMFALFGSWLWDNRPWKDRE